MTATATDVRDALEDYAREWLAGHLDRRTHEIRALLDTCRHDWSPMLQWAVFLELCDAVRVHDGIQNGSLHWSDVIPDASGTAYDEQAADISRVYVDLALDEFMGGEALRKALKAEAIHRAPRPNGLARVLTETKGEA